MKENGLENLLHTRRMKEETNSEVWSNAAKCHRGRASVENPDSPRYEETLHMNEEEVCTC